MRRIGPDADIGACSVHTQSPTQYNSVLQDLGYMQMIVRVHTQSPIPSSYTLITAITATHLLRPRGRAIVGRIYSVHT